MKADVGVTQNMDLTDLDRQLLSELRQGARTQAFLVDATDESRYRVHDRLRLLTAAGYINNIHESTALYEFASNPDTDDTGGGDTQ